MSFMDFFSKFTGGFGGASSVDLAIDLGTANTLVAITGEGVVLNEPSVVAIERSTHRVLAVGHEAKQMINHTPDAFSAEHPLRDGVIADYDVTEAMLSAFINKAIERRYPWQAKPRIVICIPCGATSVEKRAVFEAAIQSGARQAYLIEEPMAAAMGAGELLAVDVNGVGITRPNTTGLPTRIIRSHWNLGPTLDFAPERAARNIALGYFDTMRLFDRMGGTAYGILPDSSAFLKNFAERYQLRLAEVAARSPAIDLVEKTARQLANYPAPFAPNPSAPTAAALAPLELAAEHLNVPADMPYTPKLLAATVMGSFEKDPADRFPALLDGKDGSLVAEKAMAAAAPEEFVTALVSRTLADVPLL